MARIHKHLFLTALICLTFLGSQATSYSQNNRDSRDPSERETNSPQVHSTKRTVLIALARALREILCAETGDCTAENNPPYETSTPGARDERTYLTPGFGGPSSRSDQRNFSFSTPSGWQTFPDQTSVTVAPPSEYINGELSNGVILGLFDLKGKSLEAGTDKYVRGLISNNGYLQRVGWPENHTFNSVPCITTRMEGQSPKTQYFERVVVYTCKRNAQKLFYVVTVNSGPNAIQHESENSRITQSINFRQ